MPRDVFDLEEPEPRFCRTTPERVDFFLVKALSSGVFPFVPSSRFGAYSAYSIKSALPPGAVFCFRRRGDFGLAASIFPLSGSSSLLASFF